MSKRGTERRREPDTVKVVRAARRCREILERLSKVLARKPSRVTLKEVAEVAREIDKILTALEPRISV
jgi:hypothetical protein